MIENFLTNATNLIVKHYGDKRLQLYNDIFRIFVQFWIVNLIDEIRPSHKRWRPLTNNNILLKIYILQLFNNWWDKKAEIEIIHNITYRSFLWINPMNGKIPDETTICRFRELLWIHGFQETILEVVNKHLQQLGMIETDTVILDSTIIEAAKSTKNKTFSRDPEMQSTCKRNVWYFWMKVHIVSTTKALVCNLISTPANMSDINMVDELLPWNQGCIELFWDSGYISKEKIQQYEQQGIKCMFCEKWYRNHPLTVEQRKNNRKKSSIRAKVEHPFWKLKCMLSFRKAKFKWIYKNHLQLCFSFALINLITVREEILWIIWQQDNEVNTWLFA